MTTRRAGSESMDNVFAAVRTLDGLFVTDEEQRIRAWSDSATRILGYSASEVIGRPCYEVFVGQSFGGHAFCRSECPVSRNALRNRPVRDYDVLVATKDGGAITVNNSVMLWPQPKGGRAVVHLFRELRRRPFMQPSPRRRKGQPNADGDGRSPVPNPLSRREMEVLRVLSSGLPTKEMAERLGVSYYTARNQISSILRKLGVRSRLEAVTRATEYGLV
jgi:PAS domain S-box-containing protein